MSPEFYSVSEAARLCGIAPRQLSQWFYQGRLRHDMAPIVGGRRLVMGCYLPAIRERARAWKRKLPRREAIHV